MNSATDLDLKKWLSTYGVLTAERVLAKFHIRLGHEELITAIKNPRSIYFQLLRVPLKNVFNGIILQQTQDYQVYAQKLFIDYLLSGENEKEESSPGAHIREEIETERKNLVALSEEFAEQETNHQMLIAESQSSLIKLSRELQKSLQDLGKKASGVLKQHGINQTQTDLIQAIQVAIIYFDMNQDNFSESTSFWEAMEKKLGVNLDQDIRHELAKSLNQFTQHKSEIDKVLSSFLIRTQQDGENIRHFRTRFFDVILKANELIKSLPDYRQDVEKEEGNLESLNFDPGIGEKV